MLRAGMQLASPSWISEPQAACRASNQARHASDMESDMLVTWSQTC